MSSKISFREYVDSIIEVLCNTYGCALSKANEVVEEFSDFLPVCFKDGWSVFSIAEMISSEELI